MAYHVIKSGDPWGPGYKRHAVTAYSKTKTFHEDMGWRTLGLCGMDVRKPVAIAEGVDDNVAMRRVTCWSCKRIIRNQRKRPRGDEEE
jgi:hypothetical protein